jgi:hypothetical protein
MKPIAIIASTVGGVILVAGIGIGSAFVFSHHASVQPVAAAAPIPSPTHTRHHHHTKIVVVPAPAAPAAPAAQAPASSGLRYAGQGPNGGVYANSATSSPFAVAVADDYAGGGGSDYEAVYSSVTGQTYGISYQYVGNGTIEATGGNGALVQFTYP